MADLKDVEGDIRRAVDKVEAAVGLPDIDVDPLDEFREKLNAFRVFSSNDQEAADKLFESLGGQGKVEQEMLLQLGAWKPIDNPDHFEDAHHVMMRALEVLYRNGHRQAPLRLSFLTPVAQYFVQLVTRYIVRDYIQNVVKSIENLYLRRWTSTPKNTPEAFMLRRAWFQVEKVSPNYEGKSLGLPTAVAGGAFASSLTGLFSKVGGHSAQNRWIFLALAVIVYALLFALGYGVIKGAAIARRRIKMALDQPLHNLWTVVGAAGNPPKDQSATLAMWALIVMGITAVVVPVVASVIIIASS
jgi:hypothetical protein